MLGVALLIAGLSTANEIGLAVVAAAFIVFSLVSALVLPARYPGFPGRHVGWYVALGILFFVAMTAYPNWHGGWSMGNRYLLPLLFPFAPPFLALASGGVVGVGKRIVFEPVVAHDLLSR